MFRIEKEHVLKAFLYSSKIIEISHHRLLIAEYKTQLIGYAAAQGACGGNKCPDKYTPSATSGIHVECMRCGNSTCFNKSGI